MALNFPLNPTVGQQYTYPPFIYEWDGDKWVTITSPTSAADELREDLAADTGAAIVGTSTGQTVQYELDNHTHTAAEVGALPSGGTAVAAAKLSAARSIALTGDVTGSTSFDGSTNVSITTAYKNSGVTAGTYKSVTVDAKGNITAGTNPTTLAGYGITDAQASDATLTAMAGVVTAADRIIYFNGVDTALATPLTAFGRTLIDDADAATARATIGAAATSHTHAIADVTNLQTTLDGKLGDTETAAAATKLVTARTITLAGDVTGSVAFDGTANVSITAAVVDDSHNHTIANVDSLQTTLDGKLPTSGGNVTGALSMSGGGQPGENPTLRGFKVYNSSNGTEYGMNLLEPNGAGSVWGTNIFGPNQTSRFIYFSKINSATPTLSSHFTVKAQIALDNGEIWSSGNGNFNDVYIRSDLRLKSNLNRLDSALDKVNQLTGYTYDKKQDLTSQDTDREVGLIAQQVQEILPEAVTKSSKEDLLCISNSGVNALLVEAIKELTVKLQQQQEEINTLKRHIGKN